jgi:CheY-like chemotaxis protein
MAGFLILAWGTAVRSSQRQSFKAVAEDPRARILLVDDEVLVRMSIGAYLRNRGYSVIETATADEACQILVAGVPVDVLFTDISMPGSLDGIALARYAHFVRPQAKIILGTAFDRLAVAAQDLCHHDAILTKPYAYEALAETMCRLLADIKGREHPLRP